MKNTITILALFCFTMMSHDAEANLLDFTTDKVTYEQADTVLVDIFVNNINSDAAEFSFDMGFNNAALAFEQFTFDDPVFFSAMLTDAYLSAANTITLFSVWFENTDLPAANFKLGQLRFSALSAYTPTFDVSNLYVADNNFTELSSQNVVAVPLPNSASLLLMAFAVLSLRKKHLPKALN